MTETAPEGAGAGAPIACEVAVVGGGIAGLATTLALAAAGFETVCVDPQPPQPARADALDGRTTALLMPSVRALQVLGAWPKVARESAALWQMRIVDDSAGFDRQPHTADFDAHELGETPFGYNVPNPALRRGLLAVLRELPAGLHLAPARLESVDYGPEAAELQLDDGRRVQARLVVGADGKDSPCREAAGIRARRWGYGQTAMAFTVRHDRDHRNTSIEFHRRHGPFVLVPLPGRRSSAVWVERTAPAERLMALDDAAFLSAAERRSRRVLGDLLEVGRRFDYPVQSLLADRYAAHRLVLVGESAHALPPIGAQGLNLGLTDMAVLTELLVAARAAGEDPGALAVTRRYERWRRADVVARAFAVDGLNWMVQSGLPPVGLLRRGGLSALDRLSPLKTRLMRQGMRPLGRLPQMMDGVAPWSA